MVRLSDSSDKMDKEEILDALNRFGKKPSETIPPLLENYLRQVAKTGETWFPWPRLKPLFVQKLLQVMIHFHEEFPADHLPRCPNVENVKFEDVKRRIMKAAEGFNGAPFTIQRLCELLTEPMKHYKRSDKFLRGLEKNFRVVSTVDPFGRKIVSESRHLVNGLDINGHISLKSDENMSDETSLFHSPYPVVTSPMKSTESPTAMESSEEKLSSDISDQDKTEKDSSVEPNESDSLKSDQAASSCDNTPTGGGASEKPSENVQDNHSEETSTTESLTPVDSLSKATSPLRTDTAVDKMNTNDSLEVNTSHTEADMSNADTLVCKESSDFFNSDTVSPEKHSTVSTEDSTQSVDSVCADSISANKRSSGEFEVSQDFSEEISSTSPEAASPPPQSSHSPQAPSSPQASSLPQAQSSEQAPSSPQALPSPQASPPRQPSPSHCQEQESSNDVKPDKEQNSENTISENVPNREETSMDGQKDDRKDLVEDIIPEKSDVQVKEEPEKNDTQIDITVDVSAEMKADLPVVAEEPSQSVSENNQEQNNVTMGDESTLADTNKESESQNDRMEEPMEED